MSTTERGYVPNHQTMAAFVIAIGKCMLVKTLSAGAVLDGQDSEFLKSKMMAEGVDGTDADAILELDHSQLTDAIDDSFQF